MIFRLDPVHCAFPDPALADDDGLLAVGGDLSVKRLLNAYRQGIFPWFSDESPILWYAPHERFVIPSAELHVSKSLAKVLRSGTFSVTFNRAFDEVIRQCATIPRKRDSDGELPGTWITADMQHAYGALHRAGYAWSVETWQDGYLAGGLYGVVVGRIFCGESMFSRRTDASKAALATLAQCGKFDLIDCQLPNDHLERLGGRMMDGAAFRRLLVTA